METVSEIVALQTATVVAWLWNILFQIKWDDARAYAFFGNLYILPASKPIIGSTILNLTMSGINHQTVINDCFPTVIEFISNLLGMMGMPIRDKAMCRC